MTDFMKLTLVKPDEMFIDQTYQRNPEDRLTELKHRQEAFDFDLFGALSIAKRPASGRYAIIDGAGRWYIWHVLLKHNEPLPCFVHEGLTIKEESKLFVDLNRERRKVNAATIFKALVAQKDKEACAIKEIMDEFGLKVGGQGKSGISSVQSVRRVYRHGVLRRVAALKANCWTDEICSGSYFEAIGMMLTIYKNIDEGKLRRVLKENLPGSINAKLRSMSGTTKMPTKRDVPRMAVNYLNERYNRHARGSDRINRNVPVVTYEEQEELAIA